MLSIKQEENILLLTLNQPKSLNAINKEIMDGLGALFLNDLADYPDVRAVVITGAGEKAFAAGADISEFPNFGAEQGTALSAKGHAVFNAVENARVPVIAAINGYSLGGGNELAMACHLRIAESHAMFGQPEVNLGLTPGYGGSVRLARYIGHARAMYLLLTGGMIDAQKAFDWGLVNELVEKGQALETAKKLAHKLAKKAPLAMQRMIRCMNTNTLTEGLEMEIKEFGASFGTVDMKEGVDAFLSKRKPTFLGK